MSTSEHQKFLDECTAVYEKDLAKMEADKTNPKDILGATKPMLGLNPSVALVWMAKAFEFGAHGRDANGVQVREKGYGEYNWRERDVSEMVYVHAMQRHMADYLDGQDLADDSKVKHLGHIMACCAILLDAEECGSLKRTRPKKGKAAELIERLTIKSPKLAAACDDVSENKVTIDLDKLNRDFDASFNRLLKEMENDSYYTVYGIDRSKTAKRRRAHGRKGKPGNKRRGRKARQ